MIKVTNHRGEMRIYPTSFLYDGKIIEEMMYGQVTKIEKQVKDLTLVEMAKLSLGEKYINGNFTYSNLKGVIDLYTFKEYGLDDYIDITELVKEVRVDE